MLKGGDTNSLRIHFTREMSLWTARSSALSSILILSGKASTMRILPLSTTCTSVSSMTGFSAESKVWTNMKESYTGCTRKTMRSNSARSAMAWARQQPDLLHAPMPGRLIICGSYTNCTSTKSLRIKPGLILHRGDLRLKPSILWLQRKHLVMAKVTAAARFEKVPKFTNQLFYGYKLLYFINLLI